MKGGEEADAARACAYLDVLLRRDFCTNCMFVRLLFEISFLDVERWEMFVKSVMHACGMYFFFLQTSPLHFLPSSVSVNCNFDLDLAAKDVMT